MKVLGRADLHMHTTFSDGWPSPTQLVDHVIRHTDLDVIAVTDHDTIEGALRAADRAGSRRRLQVIVGEEVSSRDGHILDAVGRAYTEFPGRSTADLMTAIKRGETEAGRSRYRAVGLMRYAAWGFNHQRYAVAAAR